MGTSSQVATGTPADLIQYQNDLVRTGRYEPLGRIMKMSVGASAKFTAPVDDKLYDRFGRFIDFRHCMLPIALSIDCSQLLVTAPLLRAACPKCGMQFLVSGATTAICSQCLNSFVAEAEVKLPDVPDPTFTPAAWTKDEIEGRATPDPAKTRPPMLPQLLSNRCEQENGKAALIGGTDFMFFQPVVRIAFQVETKNGLLAATVGLIDCHPGKTGLETAFLVNWRTGECHFYGGSYVIVRKD